LAVFNALLTAMEKREEIRFCEYFLYLAVFAGGQPIMKK
jgi:hypothetical protein